MALRMECVPDCYKTLANTIQSALSKIPDRLDTFSQRAVNHMSALAADKHLSKKGSSTGRFFELIVCESLAYFGISIDRQRYHLKHEGTNVEADLLIVNARNPIFVLLKTSVRERWKQGDRDGMALKHYKEVIQEIYRKYNLDGFYTSQPPIIWLVTWRENKKNTPAKAIAHTKRTGKLCKGIDDNRFISIHDEEGMNRLLEECREYDSNKIRRVG